MPLSLKFDDHGDHDHDHDAPRSHHHDHHHLITTICRISMTVCIEEPGELDGLKVSVWFRSLIAEFGDRAFCG